MKRIQISRCLALTLTLIMLLACAPVAHAEDFYWAPIMKRVTIYRARDTGSKTFGDLDEGEKVKVESKMTFKGQLWYQVRATYQDGSQQVGFMLPGAIPDGIPTTNFIGQIKVPREVKLHSAFSATSPVMQTVPAGGEIKIVRDYGGWYLALATNVFYGFVQKADDLLLTTVAPTVAPSSSTPVNSAPAGGNSSGTTTSIKLLSDKVASKGRIAKGTKLYKTNTLTDTYAYGQISAQGDCNIYYRVENDFYMVDVNGMYAYVPCQSVNVYDLNLGMPQFAGPVDAISVVGPAAPAATASTSSSSTGTVTNCSSWVSMRKKADSKSSRVAKVKKGASITILGTSGEYTKCSYNGKTGYILSSYIK